MFRNKIKVFVDLSPFYTAFSGNRFLINLREPLRDVINVSVKQIYIPPWSTATGFSAPLHVIYVKSDLVALSRSMNLLIPSPSNNTADLVLAVVTKQTSSNLSPAFYYMSDYPDKRSQNRSNLNSFWFELYSSPFDPIPISTLPNDAVWKITIELEISQADERFLGDRLL